jgi:hypothetical protein
MFAFRMLACAYPLPAVNINKIALNQNASAEAATHVVVML